jgi:GxxExxY protein
MNTDVEHINRITQVIIGCAFKVGSKMGCGFLEKCYTNALVHDLRKAGIKVEREVQLKVWYDGVVVGEYFADMIVEGVVLIELKACDSLHPAHSAQCINYLAATGLAVCLLINFGKRVDVKRIVGPTFRGASHSSSVSICAPSVAKEPSAQ